LVTQIRIQQIFLDSALIYMFERVFGRRMQTWKDFKNPLNIYRVIAKQKILGQLCFLSVLTSRQPSVLTYVSFKAHLKRWYFQCPGKGFFSVGRSKSTLKSFITVLHQNVKQLFNWFINEYHTKRDNFYVYLFYTNITNVLEHVKVMQFG